MATVTLRLTSVCSGGNHFTFTTTGAKVWRGVLNRDDLAEPVTDEEIAAAMKVIAKLVRQGRNASQTRTVLEAGVVVGV